MTCLWRSLLLGLVFTAVLSGCRSSGTPESAPESSVMPGINAEYLKPDLDVSKWVERFEGEGREIYTHRQEIVAFAGAKPGARVADIGCGTGLFTFLFSEAAGPKGIVSAVDIVPNFLKLIQERAQKAGARNIQTVLCTERSVELPPRSIDIAFLCDVYHHFEYPEHSLASIHRALKSGGELVVVDFIRVPGQSSDWILKHVRAGQEVVEAEIAAAGFRKVGEGGFLKDNYLLRFRKVGR